jgi:hypothetical protein
MKFSKLTLTPKLKRILTIVLASLGVLMLVLLAASLQSVKLKPAQAFFSGEGSQTNLFSDFAHFTETVGSLSLGEAIMLIGGFLVLFVLVLVMLSPEGRKRLIKTILRVGLTAWAIYYALNKFRPEGIFNVDSQAAELGNASQGAVTPPPYTPPMIPTWLIYVVSLLVVLFFAGIGFWLYRFLRPPKHQFQDFARAARSALKDLSDGRDWDDAVIRCYVRMSEALDQERGLHRQQAMTPQEFASRLEKAGLPSDPIRRLTRLFEKARYGGHKSSREDVNEAVTCLTAILHAVGAQA